MENKIIHYCWFGGRPLPKLAKKCIKSWKKFLPTYEIKRWDESNYDLNKCSYVKEAYKAKKYAFVSDYARFDILYNHGGIYFDTDVELIKPIDDLIKKGAIMCLETGTVDDLIQSSTVKKVINNSYINPGLILYAKPKMPVYKKLLDDFTYRHFVKQDGSYDLFTIVQTITLIMIKMQMTKREDCAFCDNIYIYPKSYFNPKGNNFFSKGVQITECTRSIHHYSASWLPKGNVRWNRKLEQKKNKLSPEDYSNYLNKISTKIRREICINGFNGLLKKVIKKIWKKR